MSAFDTPGSDPLSGPGVASALPVPANGFQTLMVQLGFLVCPCFLLRTGAAPLTKEELESAIESVCRRQPYLRARIGTAERDGAASAGQLVENPDRVEVEVVNDLVDGTAKDCDEKTAPHSDQGSDQSRWRALAYKAVYSFQLDPEERLLAAKLIPLPGEAPHRAAVCLCIHHTAADARSCFAVAAEVMRAIASGRGGPAVEPWALADAWVDWMAPGRLRVPDAGEGAESNPAPALPAAPIRMTCDAQREGVLAAAAAGSLAPEGGIPDEPGFPAAECPEERYSYHQAFRTLSTAETADILAAGRSVGSSAWSTVQAASFLVESVLVEAWSEAPLPHGAVASLIVDTRPQLQPPLPTGYICTPGSVMGVGHRFDADNASSLDFWATAAAVRRDALAASKRGEALSRLRDLQLMIPASTMVNNYGDYDRLGFPNACAAGGDEQIELEAWHLYVNDGLPRASKTNLGFVMWSLKGQLTIALLFVPAFWRVATVGRIADLVRGVLCRASAGGTANAVSRADVAAMAAAAGLT